MTVGELKKLLEDVDEDTPVLVPAFDHHYREGTGSVTSATRQKEHPGWCEFWGEEHLQEGEEKVTPVLVVS